MTTLHDLLKDSGSNRQEKQVQNVDLSGRYSKIGLSAVAAAAPYQSAAEDCKKEHAAARPASHNWTRR